MTEHNQQDNKKKQVELLDGLPTPGLSKHLPAWVLRLIPCENNYGACRECGIELGMRGFKVTSAYKRARVFPVCLPCFDELSVVGLMIHFHRQWTDDWGREWDSEVADNFVQSVREEKGLVGSEGNGDTMDDVTPHRVTEQ